MSGVPFGVCGRRRRPRLVRGVSLPLPLLLSVKLSWAPTHLPVRHAVLDAVADDGDAMALHTGGGAGSIVKDAARVQPPVVRALQHSE